jgi:hypothetical protein
LTQLYGSLSLAKGLWVLTNSNPALLYTSR